MNALESIQGTYQQESTEASGVQEDSAMREVWVGWSPCLRVSPCWRQG